MSSSPETFITPEVSHATSTSETMALHAEGLAVSRRRVATSRVSAARVTRTRDVLVEEELAQESVEVKRVAVGRMVDAVPPVRQEGDTTILPVVEEILVVERRLVLKEEVHMRRVRTTQHHVETVRLREQDVVLTRTDLSIPSSGDAVPPDDHPPTQLQQQDDAP